MSDGETMIAIFGIVFGVFPICGVWMSIAKSRMKIETARLKIEERKLELMAQTGHDFGEATAKQIDVLRAEVAALRETSTQYDLSIQHALDETQRRLATVESRTRIPTPAQVDETPVQKNGLS